ncbi:hypothetical protein AB833_17135 [Chromatiales bacterium (ex Bugula neritina AB1)]|nr:hypothetical protein AB833_17135 [Chromatiales bacterium (ex Bugula neritina AB1)]
MLSNQNGKDLVFLDVKRAAFGEKTPNRKNNPDEVIMKKQQSLALFGVLTSAWLIGCDADLDLASLDLANRLEIQKSSTNAMTVRMPESLRASDEENTDSLNESVTNAPIHTAAKETVEEVTAVANKLDATLAGASSQALYLGADILGERVVFAQEVLNEIDDAWADITSFCASVAEGTECIIPAGTLSDEEGDEREGVLTYQSTPEDKYAYSITRTTMSDFSEREQIRWNADRSLIAMNFESSWLDDEGAARQSSNLLYSESTDGNRISLRDEFILGESTFTDSQQLHQLNDGRNGVEIKTEFNWADAYSSGKWQSQALVNDDGGKLGTTAMFDDEDSIWHTRETFTKDGSLSSSEYCEETQGIDCTDPANWVDEGIDGEALSLEFDIDGEGDDLEEAYRSACEDMGLSDEECGFSETEMVILNGAHDIYENSEDVLVYLCIGTGEDELVCRAEDSEDARSYIDVEFAEESPFDESDCQPFDDDDSGCELDNEEQELAELVDAEMETDLSIGNTCSEEDEYTEDDAFNENFDDEEFCETHELDSEEDTQPES